MKLTRHSRPRAWLVAIAAVLLYGGTAAAADLSVCIDSSSPTAAMDTRLAQAVAQHEHAMLQIHRFDGSGDDGGFDLDHFNKLAGHSCDLVLGFPIDADAHGAPPGLKASTPYGHTGFVLVTPPGSHVATLDQLAAGSNVAVTYQTTPNLYFIDHRQLVADVRLSDEDSLRALARHQVPAAMLWEPTVRRYLAGAGAHSGLQIHPLHEPHANFNLVALYDARHQPAADAFEQAITAIQASGRLAELLAPYARTGAVGPSRPLARAARVERSDRRVARHCSGTAPKPVGNRKPHHDDDALPALYTAAQAELGQAKFKENCAVCHGPHLEGRAGPALKGANFASEEAQFHVRDIFTILVHNMPATEPGSLAHDDYVQIMAFLLQQNGYPAGPQQLTYDEALNSKVKLLYHGE
ncbi:hypothetical protein ATSB10_32200 [Dyella thiooxydans]|uniref:Cytochrome c domain-containing protein n=1 Tax=Dyella thiooxydans TaxID=445710 RepID=A0A160N4M2_9GAMM|nr:c-type cytochrome [Dyella thiooxydans]AND70674.1 hypothetical protein ATSB10_32200 [Dyella thiooxydans]